MNSIRWLGWRRCLFTLVIAAVIFATVIETQSDAPEIALVIGEPWEDMRKRSTAEIGPAIPGHYWFRSTESDARLRFNDPQYGFVTPLARFFTISFDDEKIGNVRMSPQIEPLLLDDTLKVLLDLQEQWLQGGWAPNRLDQFPSFADTPEWRARLRDVNRGGKAYWRAGDKYQIMLVVNRFKDKRRPTEERYLMTLEVAKSRGVP
ncbi:hypothetical protein [Pseudomonas sp. LB3P31]